MKAFTTCMRWIALLALVFGLLPAHQAAPVVAAPNWPEKVDPWVMRTSAAGQTEFLVMLSEQADLSAAAQLPTKQEKGTYVYQKLTEVASRTQGPLLADLKARGVPYRSFWVANLVWVRGDQALVQALAQRSDVLHLYANPSVRLSLPPNPPEPAGPAAPAGVEWNVTKIHAPDIWALGYTGQGVVIGGQDTGYAWSHPALKSKYRGWNGTVADHNYNWHDAIHSDPGSTCPADSPIPCDGMEHGTHTMGTMVGDDGAGNQIGVAPGARWIGCRNMDHLGNGTPARYMECYQWFIAPTDLANQNPNPALAPDVINNSWGCPPSEGCTDPNVLLSAVQNVVAAGILTVHSAGNSGSSCGSVIDPASIYQESFTVGATDSGDNIASFSSRGPVTVGAQSWRKPDVSAPGVSVRSSIPSGGYGYMSGTSMAAPNTAGMIALMFSVQPALVGQVAQMRSLVEQGAVPRTSTQLCGGIPGSTIPNNTYGWGRIDALNTYNLIQQLQSLSITKTAGAAQVAPGTQLTYALTLSHPSPLATNNVIVTDTLPINTSFVDATSGYTLNGQTVKWDLPTMGANETRQLTLTVQVATEASSSIVNDRYGARSDEVSPVSGPAVVTPVIPFSLHVSKTAPAQVAPGGIFTYTLMVSNLHPFAPQHNLVLTDVLPANVTFINATLPYELVTSGVRWELGDLPAQVTETVNLAVQVPITATGKVINSQYQATSDTAQDAGKPVTSWIAAPTQLALKKTAPATLQAGKVLTYTLTVTNTHATDPVHHAVLTDTIPGGLDVIGTSQPYSLTGETLAWHLSTLPAQSTWEVKFAVQVPLSMAGIILNEQYGVRSDETQAASGPAVRTDIHALSLTKTASTSLVEPGGWFTYTLSVTNEHPSATQHSLVLTDTLPAGVTLVSSNTAYTLNGNVVRWELDSLAAGFTWTVTLVVEVAGDAPHVIANADYAVKSAEAPEAVAGAPVLTPVFRTIYYLPIIRKN